MRAPDFWREPSLAGSLLAPLGAVWGFAANVKRRLAPHPFDPGVPVVCVGNLTMGGTGKTPVVQALARHLIDLGKRPAILLRGYGGNELGPLAVSPKTHTADQVGDEALLHATVAPTWIGADRAKSAKAAIAVGADILLMDDGLQNTTLRQHLPLIVIDGETGFGNGRVFPAGPLREFAAGGIARAKAAIIIGEDKTAVAKRLEGLAIFFASIRPDAQNPSFKGKNVVAFAGIGRPEKFFRTLEMLGADIVARRAFPDHHAFSQNEIESLLRLAEAKSAQLVTTAKDHVRLPQGVKDRVGVLNVSLAWNDPQAPEKLLSLI